MGQSASNDNSNKNKKYKKNYGSTLLGYTTTLKTSVYINKFDTDEFKGDDNLLFKPFLYGLGIHQSTHSLLTIDNKKEDTSRADSGFLLYEKNSQLWKDLMYIDQTYYNNNDDQQQQQTPLPLAPSKQQISSSYNITGDALYLNDISTACNNPMYNLDLSKRGFGSISSNIGLLPMIRKLDLSYNYLKELPQEIGHLKQLEQLIVSHNTITFIPDTICHLTSLTEFNISHNQIEKLTPFLRHLNKLHTFILGHNQLKEINAGAIQNINSNLAHFDLSYNPLTVLPAEITQLPFLRRLRLEGCPLTTSLDHFPIAHNPPSLLEICARVIVQRENVPQVPKTKDNIISLLESILTEQLYDYICDYKVCSHCHGPYFESFVSRGRWIDRNDVWIPLEYRLCSAHWSDESDRFYSMFSATFPSCTLPSTINAPPPNHLSISIIKANPTATNATTTTTRRPRFQKRRRGANSNNHGTEEISSSSSTTLVVQQDQVNTTTELILSPSSSSSSMSQETTIEKSFSHTIKNWKHQVKKSNSSLLLKIRSKR